jgi:hypothetical protein
LTTRISVPLFSPWTFAQGSSAANAVAAASKKKSTRDMPRV